MLYILKTRTAQKLIPQVSYRAAGLRAKDPVEPWLPEAPSLKNEDAHVLPGFTGWPRKEAAYVHA